MNLDKIAELCHEVNRAYCQALGDMSQPTWAEAPDWQKDSAKAGVALHMLGDYGPEMSHISWMQDKVNAGWIYGPIKDPERKQHPCLIPFSQLPKEQQAKDFIFRAIVSTIKLQQL